jgi:hypothetical protein
LAACRLFWGRCAPGWWAAVDPASPILDGRERDKTLTDYGLYRIEKGNRVFEKVIKARAG